MLLSQKKIIFAEKTINMRFSVITINYNNRDGLKKTIISVLSQIYADYEFIIIDGESTDGSLDIIKGYKNQISYWVSEKDNGIYHAMNKGVAHAQGDYCIFMNSGDCFHSSYVLNSIENLQEDIICGKMLKGETSEPSGLHRPAITLVDLMRASLPHQAMFIKRELLINHPYDEHYKILSDWKFCLQAIIFDNCTFRNIDLIVANFDTGGISSNSNGLLPTEREQILEELFPPRILADYQRLIPVDDELLDQALLLTKTSGIRKIVKGIIKIILFLSNKKK